jgi:hypothetical protein
VQCWFGRMPQSRAASSTLGMDGNDEFLLLGLPTAAPELFAQGDPEVLAPRAGRNLEAAGREAADDTGALTLVALTRPRPENCIAGSPRSSTWSEVA